jgi:O-antigen/teichoic acid export membrane protein
MLGKEGFGELGVVQSTVAMFQVFASFGLGITATKYVAEFRSVDPAKAGRIVSLSVMVAVITGLLIMVPLIIFAPWLAQRTLAAPYLAGPLRLGSPILLLGALCGAQTGVLAGFEQFRTIARINLLTGLANFPLMVGGAYLAGLTGIVGALVAGLAFNWALNHRAVRTVLSNAAVRPSFRYCAKELRVLWRFSIPAVLGGLMVGPVMWLCNAMLVNQPSGYGEMGVFNAANQWRGAILFLPGAIAPIVLPVLSNLRGKGDRSRYHRVLLYNIWFNAGVTLTVAIGISIAAPLIMASYGKGFRAGQIVLVVLSLSAVLNATIGVIGQAIASEDRMWWGMFLNMLWGGVLIASTWYLLGYGALGLSLAILIAYGFHLLTVGAYTYYFLLKQRVVENQT